VTLQIASNPTEAYTSVAHAMLACWFGGEGPLSATHVFHAEAAPPAEGGSAEIAVHERDPEQRDRRGPRALRVTFRRTGAGSDVQIAVLRVRPEVAQWMLEDVEGWARGGSECRMRALVAAPTREPVRANQPTRSKSAAGDR
jgi:hypothetical protein